MANKYTNKPIPQGVRALFSSEYKIDYIGRYKGADAFRACIPNAKTGFPTLCLVREKGISRVTDFDALDIINKLNLD